jgi:hypothetical protein
MLSFAASLHLTTALFSPTSALISSEHVSFSLTKLPKHHQTGTLLLSLGQ